MKLRNKKTGEIIEGKCFTDIVKKLHDMGDPICSGPLLSIALFEQYWKEIDEYKPAEPLIKDEKIRKAVRAWAEADGADEKIYMTIDENGSRFANKYGGYIEFAFQIDMEEGLYTIAELCGEEEE